MSMKRAKRKPGVRKGRTVQPRTPRVASAPLTEAQSTAKPTVVGIGASAGGLEAFSQLLEALPDDSDLALVLVQHLAPQHEPAKYDGMPRAAIATGMIDLVLSPAEIAAELVKISRHAYLRQPWPPTTEAGLVLDDEQLERVFTMLHASSGVDFRHYKLPTMKRRIQRRMALQKLSGFAEYVKHLQEHPTEIGLLYHDILIHVTRFFREPESYEALATHVLPALLEKRGENDPIRVWVPGCSTGEEAYSVSMTLAEFLEKEKKGGLPIQIFGTDISEAAIGFARN